jgi:hypothetical protein
MDLPFVFVILPLIFPSRYAEQGMLHQFSINYHEVQLHQINDFMANTSLINN